MEARTRQARPSTTGIASKLQSIMLFTRDLFKIDSDLRVRLFSRPGDPLTERRVVHTIRASGGSYGLRLESQRGLASEVT